MLDDERGVLPFKGGETEGLRRLNTYIFSDDCLREYKDTRNGMIGANYSSKFSPWLALGCLSPRKIHEAVRQYEAERVANKSTYWMLFELLWRDYFHFWVFKIGNCLFFQHGPMDRRDLE